jgi:hypothetical protein
MDADPGDVESSLVLRLVAGRDGALRVRVIAVDATEANKVLGVVTTATGAAALVRSWIEQAMGTAQRRADAPPENALDGDA